MWLAISKLCLLSSIVYVCYRGNYRSSRSSGAAFSLCPKFLYVRVNSPKYCQTSRQSFILFFNLKGLCAGSFGSRSKQIYTPGSTDAVTVGPRATFTGSSSELEGCWFKIQPASARGLRDQRNFDPEYMVSPGSSLQHNTN
ncbi:hypothetical protein CY34DRAFT_177278 [Suillus luteus UH-Slu-Lm8-n1]|uniref:Unplaced genomic scaffold CY34scaffold_122, whole genome shotgun sequence n=1 Tax=Suillus luteus UH-Slu-Lm8-n1 TaxID=930992 RepID=A0A0C9ZVS2_9AGAM|nr:hypothetical protein CY34DRAFT_177278 [Suillus luteus UH-Slu-Lm8-n1]